MVVVVVAVAAVVVAVVVVVVAAVAAVVVVVAVVVAAVVVAVVAFVVVVVVVAVVIVAVVAFVVAAVAVVIVAVVAAVVVAVAVGIVVLLLLRPAHMRRLLKPGCPGHHRCYHLRSPSQEHLQLHRLSHRLETVQNFLRQPVESLLFGLQDHLLGQGHHLHQVLQQNHDLNLLHDFRQVVWESPEGRN